MEPIRDRIEGGFWQTYQALVRERVLPYQWKAMNDEIPGVPKSHSVQNFRITAGLARGSHDGMVFQDSDLSKWLEAVGHVLLDDPEGAPSLREQAREAVELIAAAQQPDGYVNTYFTVKEPERRWTNLRDAHELYCSGHLIEAGVAMFRGAGDRKLLDVVRRLASELHRDADRLQANQRARGSQERAVRGDQARPLAGREGRDGREATGVHGLPRRPLRGSDPGRAHALRRWQNV